MTSEFYELECGGDQTVVMEVTAAGTVVLHDEDYDVEAEQAAVELGFEPSVCFIVRKAWLLQRQFPGGRCLRAGHLNAALMTQSEEGNAAAAAALIAAGADVNVGTTGFPLKFACDFGHADVVEVLLAAGADVHVYDDLGEEAPLRIAARSGYADVVELLLEAGAKPWAPPSMPDQLLWTTEGRYPDVVRIIKKWLGW